MNDCKTVIDIFNKNPNLIIDLISANYALDENLLTRYENYLNWELINNNEKINWSERIVNKFKHKWDYFKLCENKFIPWDENIIKNIPHYCQWNILSKNESLPWSEEFIQKFETNWNWYHLSANKKLPWSEELIEKYKNKWKWDCLTNKKAILWSDDLFFNYKKNLYLNRDTLHNLKLSNDFLDRELNINEWSYLSSGNVFNWSVNLIDKHIEKWDWTNLSNNKFLPWSEDFIRKYENRWNWYYISNNPKLPWTTNLIEKYKGLINWDNLSKNEGVLWTWDLIEKYKDKWNWYFIGTNDTLLFDKNIIGKYKEKWNSNKSYSDTDIDDFFIIKLKPNWKCLNQNKSIEWTEDLLTEFEEYIDWDFLSSNEKVKWSLTILEKYKNYFHWGNLTRNKSINWTEEIIDKFNNELENEFNIRNNNMSVHLLWSYDKYEEKFSDWLNLCSNPNVSWSHNFIKKYKDKIYFNRLQNNNAVPWSITLIEEYANELSESILIWNTISPFIDDNLVFDFLIKSEQLFIESKMKIAGHLTVSSWKKLEINLTIASDDNWAEAFTYFDNRIRTRYLNPIKAILEIGDDAGEGFAVVNLQCSLIETIESFINGWIYFNDGIRGNQKGWFKNKINAKTYRNEINNEYIFVSFFNNHEFFKIINGREFYFCVRCSLLHETQTKNNWKIRLDTRRTKKNFVEEASEKIIYRENFQRDLEATVENYKNAISKGENLSGKKIQKFNGIEIKELRENFRDKFNHICKESILK
jgi:hypothetical protein